MNAREDSESKVPHSTLKEALLSSYKGKEIEKNTFLIWFGPKIPEKKHFPGGCGHTEETVDYLGNIFKHKEYNRDINVHLIVSKKLMNEDYFLSLKTECELKDIFLVDFDNDKSLKDCLNRDLVERFLERPCDYVCASDVLRLSLLFHKGGRYFDVDLIMLDDYYCSNKKDLLGFPRPENQKYGLSFFDVVGKGWGEAGNGYGYGFEFHALEAAKQHPLYLLFLASSRYISMGLLDGYESYPLLKSTTNRHVRSRLVMDTTGATITELIDLKNNQNPFNKVMVDARITSSDELLYSTNNPHHKSWLNKENCEVGYEFKCEDTSEIHNLKDLLEKIFQNNESYIEFIYQKALEYFPDHCEELKKLYPLLIQSINHDDADLVSVTANASVDDDSITVLSKAEALNASSTKIVSVDVSSDVNNTLTTSNGGLTSVSMFNRGNKNLNFDKLIVYYNPRSNELILDYGRVGIEPSSLAFIHHSLPHRCKNFIKFNWDISTQIHISCSSDVLEKSEKRLGFYVAKNGEAAIAFPSEKERNKCLEALGILKLGVVGCRAEKNKDKKDRSNAFYFAQNYLKISSKDVMQNENEKCLVM